METIETIETTTTRNADIWSRYFQDEWSRWMPRNSEVSQMADGTAARVAGFLSLVAAGPIAWLYANNEPRVVEIRPEPDLQLVDELESIEDSAA